jgi:hypothetical protein
MKTVSHKQLRFESLFGKQVTADFDGSNITSDAGALLLLELDKRLNLTEGTAECLDNPRYRVVRPKAEASFPDSRSRDANSWNFRPGRVMGQI